MIEAKVVRVTFTRFLYVTCIIMTSKCSKVLSLLVASSWSQENKVQFGFGSRHGKSDRRNKSKLFS